MNTQTDDDLDTDLTTTETNVVETGKLGVYDRPERQGLSPILIILLVLLALAVAYLLWRFVF